MSVRRNVVQPPLPMTPGHAEIGAQAVTGRKHRDVAEKHNEDIGIHDLFIVHPRSKHRQLSFLKAFTSSRSCSQIENGPTRHKDSGDFPGNKSSIIKR